MAIVEPAKLILTNVAEDFSATFDAPLFP